MENEEVIKGNEREGKAGRSLALDDLEGEVRRPR
jgi:hypothetical protein